MMTAVRFECVMRGVNRRLKYIKCMHHSINGVSGITATTTTKHKCELAIMIVVFRQYYARCFTFHITKILFFILSLHFNHQFARGMKKGNGNGYAWLSIWCCYMILWLYHKVVVFTFFPRSMFRSPKYFSSVVNTCVFIHLGIVLWVCMSTFLFALIFSVVIKTARQLMLMFVSYWVLVFIRDGGIVSHTSNENEQTLFLSFLLQFKWSVKNGVVVMAVTVTCE